VAFGSELQGAPGSVNGLKTHEPRKTTLTVLLSILLVTLVYRDPYNGIISDSFDFDVSIFTVVGGFSPTHPEKYVLVKCSNHFPQASG